MSPANLSVQCWKCGQEIPALPMPLGRREECPTCGTDLHVCRQCEMYDTGVANACREPVADVVKDKERANFCGYFSPAPQAYAGVANPGNELARAKLETLFGDGTPDGTNGQEPESEAERAKRKLDSLFGLDD